MNLTNNANLPPAIVAAVANDGYSSGRSSITVSQLPNPPRLVALYKQHADEITEDAADRIWLLLGKAVHSVLESAGDDDLKEERLYAEVEGWILGGMMDRMGLYDHDGGGFCLDDYKVTSVWSVKDGAKPEWEAQLNLYWWLVFLAGVRISRLRIVAILRDWRQSERLRYGDSYPERNVAVIDVPVWGEDRCRAYATERVRMHQTAQSGDLPDCTPEERWQRPAVFAVMKEGRKSAVKLHDTEDAAQAHAAELGAKHYVEHRPGVNVRCETYCPVAAWCDQWAKMKPADEKEAA